MHIIKNKNYYLQISIYKTIIICYNYTDVDVFIER